MVKVVLALLTFLFNVSPGSVSTSDSSLLSPPEVWVIIITDWFVGNTPLRLMWRQYACCILWRNDFKWHDTRDWGQTATHQVSWGRNVMIGTSCHCQIIQHCPSPLLDNRWHSAFTLSSIFHYSAHFNREFHSFIIINDDENKNINLLTFEGFVPFTPFVQEFEGIEPLLCHTHSARQWSRKNWEMTDTELLQEMVLKRVWAQQQ